jgi:hypothetical protein
MQNSPENNPPLWAKALGIVFLITLAVFVLAFVVPLAMRLLIWAWAGVS